MIDETASEQPEKSLRDTIQEQMTEVQTRERDDSGRFASKQEESATDVAVEGAGKPKDDVQAEPAIEAPHSWKNEAKAHWDSLPKEVKQYIVDRETEVHKGFTRQDEERTFGKQLKDVINPYMPLIQAEGGTAAQAVQSLLNTAYTLRTATTAQKVELVRQMAQQYGVPLEELAQPQQWVDPALESLQQRLERIERENQALQQQRQMQQAYETESSIAAFGSKPGHEHLDKIAPHMSALIQQGLVQGSTTEELLENAYQQAVWAHPDLRSTLLLQQQQESEAKRAAEAKQKAEAARKAAGSVSGSPGVNPAAQTPERSLRDELRAQLRASQS